MGFIQCVKVERDCSNYSNVTGEVIIQYFTHQQHRLTVATLNAGAFPSPVGEEIGPCVPSQLVLAVRLNFKVVALENWTHSKSRC